MPKNKWDFLIRYKEGSIPSIMEEYREIADMGEVAEKVLEKEKRYRRKPGLKQKLQIYDNAYKQFRLQCHEKPLSDHADSRYSDADV